VTSQYGRYPHTGDGVELRRIFHKLRSSAIENFNEQFKGISDGHGQVPTKGLLNTSAFAGRHLALSVGAPVSLSTRPTLASRTQGFLEGRLTSYDHASANR